MCVVCGNIVVRIFILLLFRRIKTFICRGFLIPVTGTKCTSVDIGANANLELVDKFCYLGDMLSVEGDADAAVNWME